MMRKLMALGALCAAVTLPLAAAEAEITLDELLERHYEAIGGVEAWDGWKTLRMTGTMTAGGGQMEAPFTMTFANGNPGKSRLEFTVQGMTGIMAYDGEVAWAVSPFMGKTEPEPMPEEQTDNWREQSDFGGPLLHPGDKGIDLALVGMADVEGTAAYKVRVTLDTGDVRYLYLDSEYYLPIRQESKTTIQGNEIEIETTFGEFKEVGGMVFAHSFESKPKGAPSGQAISIEDADIDVDLPNDFFSMPATVSGSG